MKPKTKFSKYEKGGKTQDPPAKKKRDYTYLLNPRNWTVENLGEEPSFNQAFKKARKMGLTEFLYNGRRYNTQSNESPKTQFNKFGNTNELLNADLSPETKRNLLMIEDSFYRSGDVLPERYERGGRGQYLNDLLKLHERAGNPSIDLSNGRIKDNILIDGYRSSYKPMFNSMQLSWPVHYFAELAHAVQDEDTNLPDIQGLFFDTPARAFTDVYELPGTSEYEAHKVIEPRLKFRMDYHAKPWTPGYDTLKFTNGDPRRWAGVYPGPDEEPFTKEDSAYVEEGNRLKALDKADSTNRAEKMKAINKMRFAAGGKMFLGGPLEGGPITGDPKKKSVRRVSPEIIQTYSQHTNQMPLAHVEEADPLFYDRNQFNDFYRKKAVGKMTPEQLELYQSGGTDPAWGDAIIARYGGIPDFGAYQQAVRAYEKTQITNPTNWAALDAPGYKVEGYRYNAGKPDRESITLPRKAFGGTIGLTDPKPKYTQENLDAARDLRQKLTPTSPTDYSRTPWENPDRQWWGGDTGLGKGEDLYIDDAGNLKPKPRPAFNAFANLGLVQRPMVAMDKVSTADMINLIRLRSGNTGRFNKFVDNFNAQTQRTMNQLPPAENYATFIKRTVPPRR